MEFQGQDTVVVGGATGIGSGICRALVARGARVHLCDIDVEGAGALAAELPEGSLVFHACDVTDAASLEAAAQAIAGDGGIAAVFVNAGAIVLRPFVDTTSADWQWLMGINFFGTVNAISAFLPRLLAQDRPSRIAVTSSVAALRTPPMPGQTMYMASKSAQLGLCSALRTELEGTQVGLSVIFPGAVRTPLRDKSEAKRPGAIQVVVPPAMASESRYIEPELAGERIVRGIEADRPFISPHPGEREQVRAMQDRILTAFEE